jgi:hypothetical protein
MRRHVIASLFICLGSAALAQSSSPPKKPQAPPPAAKSTRAPPAAPASSRPSVCVASNVGHKFEVFTIGLTVFGNALATADINAWGLDDLVVRKVGALLGGHFAVRRVVLDRAALAAFEAPKKSILEGGPLFRDTDKEFLEILKAAAGPASKCDYYLAIFRGTSNIGDSHLYLNGIGILNRDAVFSSSQLLHAILVARLYDGTTFEVRKTELVHTGPAFDPIRDLTGPGFRGLSQRIDKSWLPNPPQAAAQNLKLRDATWALIEPGLANTIPAMLAPE